MELGLTRAFSVLWNAGAEITADIWVLESICGTSNRPDNDVDNYSASELGAGEVVGLCHLNP